MTTQADHKPRINPRLSRVALLLLGCALFLGLFTLPAAGDGARLSFAVTVAANTPTPSPTPPPAAPEQYTPLLVSVLAPPAPVKLADGYVYLAYELSLINATESALTVEAVEVRDAGRGDALLLRLSQPDVAASLRIPGVLTPTGAFSPSQAGILALTLAFETPDEVPALLEHWITVRATTPTRVLRAETVERVARAQVVQGSPIVIGPPLEGGGWVATNVLGQSHHRYGFVPINGAWAVSQRFATDYLQLSAELHLVTGDPKRNESFPQYGQPVIAVADGTVVTARDGLPDLVPGESLAELTTETAPGNHVVMQLAPGVCAFYAHFKPGSLAVRAGERVRRGQLLGRVGNSGNSDGPHLHFHMMDGPLPLGSNGIPYAIDGFTVEGQVVALDSAVPYQVQLAPIEEPERHKEMPADWTVVAFPVPGD